MKNYIGVKMVQAEEMSRIAAKEKGYYRGEINEENPGADMGYHVRYEDGYDSWSPAETFERSYFRMKAKDHVTQKDCERFLMHENAAQIGKKTTVVLVKSITGFEYLESSSCVDEKKFDMEVGRKYAMERVMSKVWENLGFVLQWAISGLDKPNEDTSC